MRSCQTALGLVMLSLALAGCKPDAPTLESHSGAAPGAPRTYEVKGTILSLKPEQSAVVIEHEEIPGYMSAMTMPFFVHDTNELAGLIPGEEVRFKMIITQDDAWIEDIEKTGQAKNILPPNAGIRIVRDVEPLDIGDVLPDYSLTNEFGQRVQLSQYRGKALVLAFLFTRCPLPMYCPLTTRKLAETQEALLARSTGPTNWHLLAVTVDPEFDTPARLKQFGETYHYKPERWSFATGDLTDITALAEQFGLMFWEEGGTISHNLRTVVVDADGIIRTNMVGNEWKVETLVAEVVEAAAGSAEKK
jgi:protein SCO1/2